MKINKRSFVPEKICKFYEKYVNVLEEKHIVTLETLWRLLNEPTLYLINVLGNPERGDEFIQLDAHFVILRILVFVSWGQ